MVTVLSTLLATAQAQSCPDYAEFHTVFTVSEETWNPCVLDPSVTRLCTADPYNDPDTHTDGRLPSA